MAYEARLGKDWRHDELDAIVADYFEMLDAELGGRPYVKLKHSRALMERIGRTHRSVEFKHQNISAVLKQLGLPWIAGYKPKPHYQNSLFDAIDRYLNGRPEILQFVPPVRSEMTATLDIVFVDPPKRSSDRVPEQLRRLVVKFDPVERDRRNRGLGIAGEDFVFDLERRRLTELDRRDLARKVRWVAVEDGDGAGYDVLSYDPNGEERLIEVKTTNGSARTPFFLSRNEYEVAAERPAQWRIYRVHLFATEPRVFTITPPLDEALNLRPESWRAAF